MPLLKGEFELLLEKVESSQQSIAKIAEGQERLENGQKRLELILLGNGQPGLKGKVEQHDRDLEDVKKTIGRWSKSVWGLVSALLLAVVSFVWSVACGWIQVIRVP
jgi:hypothetical protein